MGDKQCRSRSDAVSDQDLHCLLWFAFPNTYGKNSSYPSKHVADSEIYMLADDVLKYFPKLLRN